MRHLKLFEETVYKVGDYVKLKVIPNYVIAIDKINDDNLFTKIVQIDDKWREDNTYAFMTSEGEIIVGYVYLIRRKMNKREVEEYKMREQIKTYNL